MKKLDVTFFNAVVDCGIQSLEDRFQSLGEVNDKFGVLLNFSDLEGFLETYRTHLWRRVRC